MSRALFMLPMAWFALGCREPEQAAPSASAAPAPPPRPTLTIGPGTLRAGTKQRLKLEWQLSLQGRHHEDQRFFQRVETEQTGSGLLELEVLESTASRLTRFSVAVRQFTETPTVKSGEVFLKPAPLAGKRFQIVLGGMEPRVRGADGETIDDVSSRYLLDLVPWPLSTRATVLPPWLLGQHEVDEPSKLDSAQVRGLLGRGATAGKSGSWLAQPKADNIFVDAELEGTRKRGWLTFAVQEKRHLELAASGLPRVDRRDYSAKVSGERSTAGRVFSFDGSAKGHVEWRVVDQPPDASAPTP